MSKLLRLLQPVCFALAILTACTTSAEETADKPHQIDLAGGHLQLPVPAAWKQVKPRSRIIQHEFSIPVSGDDKLTGRMTIMAASGGIDANIARWVAQFKSNEGKPLDNDAKKFEKKKIAGLEIHLVDLTGDYQDKPRGPFGPSVNRSNYRMLAAIIPTQQNGTWFIKLYGPSNTIAAAKPGFDKMIEGMVWKQ